MARNTFRAAYLAIMLAVGTTTSHASPATVVRVIDGDTLLVRISGDTSDTRVRLANIDAPESAQDYGRMCKANLASMVDRRTVEVVVAPTVTDKYGRTVATVFVNGLDANLQQLVNGCAWHWTSFAFVQQTREDFRRYQTAQLDAQRAHIGLWSDPSAINPREFREGRR